MTILAMGLASPASADEPPPSVIKDCGIVTCSTYYSHAETVRLDQITQEIPSDQLSITVGFACIIGSPVACIPLGAIAFGVERTTDIIHHAATTNGCVRFRTIRGTDDVLGNAVYADHSKKCHSMDT